MTSAGAPRVRANAEVFDSALLAGRAEAAAEVTPREVKARVGDQEFTLPLQGLQAQLTGIDLEMLRLTHASHPQRVIVLRDLELARAPPLSEVPSIAEALEGNRSAQRRLWGCGCSAALSLVVLLALFFLFFDHAVRWAVDRLPMSVERELGDVLVESAHAGQQLVTDAESLAALETLAAPLLAHSPGGVPVELYIVRDDSLNAYALPGGHVTLHSGLIQRAETPEQVLGVLAHEMAHVSERHSLQGMAGRLGLVAIVQMVLGDASALVSLAGETVAALADLEFSRDLEEEADRGAVEALVAAGIDPRGLLDFFARLSSEEEGALMPAFLRTHPPTEARRAALETTLAALPTVTRRRPPEDLGRLQAAVARSHP